MDIVQSTASPARVQPRQVTGRFDMLTFLDREIGYLSREKVAKFRARTDGKSRQQTEKSITPPKRLRKQ
jgi:hypothetical protein